MSELLKEHEELLKKHLPEQLGETLRKELYRLKEVEVKAEQLQKELERCKNSHNDLLKQIRHQDDILTIQRETNAKIADLETRERNLKVAILEIKLAESEKRAEVLTDLSKTVFRNSVVQKTVFENQSGNYEYNSQTNRSEFMPNGNKDLTITKSEQ